MTVGNVLWEFYCGNHFKNISSLPYAIPVLRFHAGHTHDFLDRDGFQFDNPDFCKNISFKKIRVIKIPNCRVEVALNSSSFQSRFSEKTVGCSDVYYYIQTIQAPTTTINIPSMLRVGYERY